MMKRLRIFLFLNILCLFTVAQAETDTENLGWFTGSVVYHFNKIGSNKYMLEANTASGVSPEKLLTAYQGRAAKLCSPKTPSIRYNITTETYMGTFNATMRVPMKAPKITGIVICE